MADAVNPDTNQSAITAHHAWTWMRANTTIACIAMSRPASHRPRAVDRS
jgi:hypothetical protein